MSPAKRGLTSIFLLFRKTPVLEFLSTSKEAAVLKLDLGVIAGNGGIVEHQVIVQAASDPEYRFIQWKDHPADNEKCLFRYWRFGFSWLVSTHIPI